MILKSICAVAACKLTRQALRLFHRGGTALPGKTARLFDPDILKRVSEGMEIIVVTGTNGKTTTCSMLENALRAGGRECLSNKSGANLLSGVTAELTCNATWSGKPKTHYAVIECDEGALKQVAPLILPKVIIVTNLFRDQLDRYGEVMHTLDEIRTGILASPGSILCLNADDSLTGSLAGDVPNPVVWYGLDTSTGEEKEPVLSDARYCIRCGTEYGYHYHTYAHLGGFFCPKCGYSRPEPDFAVTQIEEMNTARTRCRVRMSAAPYEMEITVGLPAVYNLYNAMAALCACTAFGLPAEECASSLKTVHSSFGRMENFTLGKTSLQMILVKNPAGCSQALEYLSSVKEPCRALFALNDRTADGHDISWIWDADYEKICASGILQEILVLGDRAEDMQLRLKYAGADTSRISIVREAREALKWIEASSVPVFAFPNYTSMLELREAVRERTGEKEFWQ